MTLDEEFRWAPLRNLAEAKRYPRGGLTIKAGKGWALVTCRASMVHVNEDVLWKLASALDRRVQQEKMGFRDARSSNPPRIAYVVRSGDEDFWTLPDPRIKSIGEQIHAVLRGTAGIDF